MELRQAPKSHRTSLSSLPLFKEIKNSVLAKSRKSNTFNGFHSRGPRQEINISRQHNVITTYNSHYEGHLPILFYYNGFQPEPITSVVRSMLEVEVELEEVEKNRLKVLGADYFRPIGFRRGKKLFSSPLDPSKEKSSPSGSRSGGLHRLQEAISQEWRDVDVSRSSHSNSINTAAYLMPAVGPDTYHNPLGFRLHEESEEVEEDEPDDIGGVLGPQGTETGELECTFEQSVTLGCAESEPDVSESLDEFLDGLEDLSTVDTSLQS